MRSPRHRSVPLCSACRGDYEDPDAASAEEEEQEDGDESVEEFPA